MNRLIVIAVGLTGLLIWLLALVPTVPGQVPLLILLGLASLSLAILLHLRSRNLANATDCRIDERERARRDHAHRIAYWSLSLPVGLFVGFSVSRIERALRAGTDLVIELEQLTQVSVLLWLLILFWCCLPAMILLWTEPKPLERDEPA